MSPKTLTLTILDGSFAVHRFSAGADIPRAVLKADFFALARTTDELSVVAAETTPLEAEQSEKGWACLKLQGPFDFGEVGILAGIASALAQSAIPIFVFSTFDTDYILVKHERLKEAREALTAAGYKVVKPRPAKAEEKASGLRGAADAVLEKHIPAIRSLLVDKIGAAALAAMRSKAALGLAIGSVYEFLPAAVRIVIPRQTFVDFVLENMDRILPEQKPAPKKKSPAKGK